MPMKMAGLKCFFSIIKKRGKSKLQKGAFKILKGTTLSYSKILRSFMRICFSDVEIGVISLDYRCRGSNGLTELSSSSMNPLEHFVKSSTISAMQSSVLHKERSIDEVKAIFSTSNGLIDPRPLVEWRTVETSMEDGPLGRAAVNRNVYDDCRFAVSKPDGKTRPYMESSKESRNYAHLALEECTNSLNDSPESRYQDTAVLLGSLKDNDLSVAENRANMQQKFDDNAAHLLDAWEWDTFKENISKRGRAERFPPPLAFLSGKLSSSSPHEAPCLQLQRIRGNGRFVLQEIKVPPRLLFKSTRLKGRLILQSINHKENFMRKLSRNRASLSQDPISSRPEIKAENSYRELLSNLQEDTILLQQNIPVMSSPLASRHYLSQKHTHSKNSSNKQDDRESTFDYYTRLISPKTMDSKDTLEASYANFVRRSSLADIQDVDTDSVTANLVHGNRESHLKHDIIHFLIYCADFLDSHLPRKVSGHLKTGAKLYEHCSMVLSDPFQSLLRFFLFNLRNVMNGIDPASYLRCKGFESCQEDYVAAWESRCLANS